MESVFCLIKSLSDKFVKRDDLNTYMSEREQDEVIKRRRKKIVQFMYSVLLDKNEDYVPVLRRERKDFSLEFETVGYEIRCQRKYDESFSLKLLQKKWEKSRLIRGMNGKVKELTEKNNIMRCLLSLKKEESGRISEISRKLLYNADKEDMLTNFPSGQKFFYGDSDNYEMSSKFMFYRPEMFHNLPMVDEAVPSIEKIDADIFHHDGNKNSKEFNFFKTESGSDTLFGALIKKTMEPNSLFKIPDINNNLMDAPPTTDVSIFETWKSSDTDSNSSQIFSSPPKKKRIVTQIDWTNVELKKRFHHRLASEQGLFSLDRIYKQYFVHRKNAPYEPLILTEEEVIRDCIAMLQGIGSTTFTFNALRYVFEPIYLRLTSTTVKSIRSVLFKFAEVGSLAKRLDNFCMYHTLNPQRVGLVRLAFSQSVTGFLEYYRGCILKLPSAIQRILSDYPIQDTALTLLNLLHYIQPIVTKLQALAQICFCDIQSDNIHDNFNQIIKSENGLECYISTRILRFPKGGKFLSYLYQVLKSDCEDSERKIVLYFFKQACRPYFNWIRNWIYFGSLSTDEFFIRQTMRPEELNLNSTEDSTAFWSDGYQMKENCLPEFLRQISDAIFSVGQGLCIIRLYDPTHYLLKYQDIPELNLNADQFSIRRLRKQYLKLAIIQQTEHEKHLEELTQIRIQHLEKAKENSHSLREKIEKYQVEIIELAKSKALRKRELLEERMTEIENRQNLKLQERVREEKMEKEERIRLHEIEKKRQSEAKEKMIRYYNEQVQVLQQRKRLAEWKYQRQLLTSKRLNKLKWIENQEAQWKLKHEMNMNISGVDGNPYLQSPIEISPDTESPSQPRRSSRIFNLSPSNSEDELVQNDVIQMESFMNDESAIDAQQTPDSNNLLNDSSHGTKVNDEEAQTENDHLLPEPYAPEDKSIKIDQNEDPMEIDENEDQMDIDSDENGHENSFDVSSISIIVDDLQEMEPENETTQSTNKNHSVKEKDYYYELFAENVEEDFMLDVEQECHDFEIQSSLPLDLMLTESLMKPIYVHYRTIHSTVLSIFRNELHIEEHLDTIRKFFLLRAGDFVDNFYRQIIVDLHKGEMWFDSHKLNHSFMNVLKDMNYDSEYTKNLSFRTVNIDDNQVINTHSISALHYFELRYEVGWPINIFVNTHTIAQYNTLFRFFLTLKRVMIEMQDTWIHFKHKTIRQSMDPKIRQLQLFRQEIQHFLSIMNRFVLGRVVDDMYERFLYRMKHEATTLEHARKLHQEFLNSAERSCLLHKGGSELKKVIDGILDVVLRFRMQILSNPLHLNLSSSAYQAMMDTRRRYKELSNLFIKILRKQSRVSNELGDLLRELNFNNFYQGQ